MSCLLTAGPATCAATSTVVERGLFNPFTLGGTIVVDNVVASVHSDWFLDPLYDWLHIPHLLPATYQVRSWPARAQACDPLLAFLMHTLQCLHCTTGCTSPTSCPSPIRHTSVLPGCTDGYRNWTASRMRACLGSLLLRPCAWLSTCTCAHAYQAACILCIAQHAPASTAGALTCRAVHRQFWLPLVSCTRSSATLRTASCTNSWMPNSTLLSLARSMAP